MQRINTVSRRRFLEAVDQQVERYKGFSFVNGQDATTRVQRTYGKEYVPFIELTGVVQAETGLTANTVIEYTRDMHSSIIEDFVVSPSGSHDTTFIFIKPTREQ